MQKNIFIAFLALAGGCSVARNENPLSENPIVETKIPKFFASVSIAEFNDFECPCFEAEIEGEMYLLKLDLGFQGDLSVRQEKVDLISSKSFVKEHTTFGIRGKEYQKKLYRIPKLKIGSMTFSPPILHIENDEFLKDAEFIQDGKSSTPRREDGRLGYPLFSRTNLLIDIPNSQIAFCDSITTLNEENYPIETFCKTALLLDQGLVEIDINTPDGPMHCVLDTGSTWNVLNAPTKSEKSLDDAVWDPETITNYPWFEIKGTDFGPISFHRMPIELPIQVDAILGMEFFRTNRVFLDFSEKYVYVQIPATEEIPK